MTRPLILERILALWSDSVKAHELRCDSRFKRYFVRGLDAPTVSWNLFVGEAPTLTGAELEESEREFRRDRPSISRPYISFPRLNGFAEPACLAAGGYELVNGTFFCFTERLFEDDAVEPFTVVEGTFENEDVYEEYARTTLEVFELNDRVFPEFNRDFNRDTNALNLILNYRKNGETAGTTCVSVFGSVGWLYGDAVREPFRKKGLWSSMVRARQDRSAKIGANSWFLQTEHPYMADKFEARLEVLTYRRR